MGDWEKPAAEAIKSIAWGWVVTFIVAKLASLATLLFVSLAS